MGSESDTMVQVGKLTILILSMTLVSMTKSRPNSSLVFSSRGLCVSTLCSDDGDLICEYLCYYLVGDTQGLQENNRSTTTSNTSTTSPSTNPTSIASSTVATINNNNDNKMDN